MEAYVHVLHFFSRLFYMYTGANNVFLGVQHFTLLIQMFVFAFLNICSCISRHVCLHFLTYVTSYVLHLPLLARHLSLHIINGAGSTDVFLSDHIFRNTYAMTHAHIYVQKYKNKCTHMQQQMHKQKYCANIKS